MKVRKTMTWDNTAQVSPRATAAEKDRRKIASTATDYADFIDTLKVKKSASDIKIAAEKEAIRTASAERSMKKNN